MSKMLLAAMNHAAISMPLLFLLIFHEYTHTAAFRRSMVFAAAFSIFCAKAALLSSSGRFYADIDFLRHAAYADMADAAFRCH